MHGIDTTTDLSAAHEAPWEIRQLSDWLQQGKSEFGWRGDPRLELRIGLVRAARNGIDPKVKRWVSHGTIVGQNLQVWRHCEDGKDRMILTRKLSAWPEIIPALIESDPRTPGYNDVMDRIEASNAAKQRAQDSEMDDARGDVIDKLWSYVSNHSTVRLGRGAKEVAAE